MKFVYDSSDFPQGKSHSCWLLANGLGGFASTSEIFSVTRNDQGLLIAADSPSQRRRIGTSSCPPRTLPTAPLRKTGGGTCPPFSGMMGPAGTIRRGVYP